MTQPSKLRTYGSRLKRKLSGEQPANGAPPAKSGDAWRQRRQFPAESTIPMPPEGLRGKVGSAPQFHDVALTTMGRMSMAGLRPDHDVLDIGCGVGRTARYLCGFLEGDARYEGFDVTEVLVEWCQENITPRFPNFHFTHTPLYHLSYDPDHSLPSAAEFTFPYADESFDFVFAHSVFTHLLPDVTANYLNEVSRVLRPGGTSYSTWILFNDEPSAYSNPRRNGMVDDPSGRFAVREPANVGYREEFVREMHASSGLKIVEPIHEGFRRFQDAIVAVK